jgi:hypothetical protein
MPPAADSREPDEAILRRWIDAEQAKLDASLKDSTVAAFAMASTYRANLKRWHGMLAAHEVAVG